jgi:hypothetical protein
MKVVRRLTAPAGSVRSYPEGRSKSMEAAGAPASAGRPAEYREAVKTAWRGAANRMAATLACERFEGRDKPMRVVGWR